MAYTTGDLNGRTLADFELLASKQGECWCMFYQRATPAGRGLSSKERKRKNRRDKEALVRRGRSHVILVYDGQTPVGWCQYGRGTSSPGSMQGGPIATRRPRSGWPIYGESRASSSTETTEGGASPRSRCTRPSNRSRSRAAELWRPSPSFRRRWPPSRSGAGSAPPARFGGKDSPPWVRSGEADS